MGKVMKQSAASRAMTISLRTNTPVSTVERILREYHKSLEESVIDGERIVLDGIMSVSVVEDGVTGEYSTRGRVSPVLKAKINQNKLAQVN